MNQIACFNKLNADKMFMTVEEKWPQRGELVIGTVVRVNPYSAFISLEEYGNKEGMIHISEVAGKWVRDIRKFVKVGDKIVVKVMDVNPEKMHIALSLKRVRKYDSEEKMREYKKRLKAEKMLKLLAKSLNISVEEVNRSIVPEIEDKFGNAFDVFQMSMTPQGYDVLVRKGIKEEIVKAIKAIAEEQLEIKEAIIKKIIELRCYKPDGMNIIRSMLIDAKKNFGIDIKYISAPRYSLSLKTKNAKLGERKINETSEYIIKKIEECDGEGKVE
jgi:translation initiation factor 2 subunit 1